MADHIVDLRSDTQTRPTDAMLEAMHQAEVGDDVYGEDPTVNALQEKAAACMGMEAALFVPSGTMGNTCALMAHTRPGEEVIFEAEAHMYNWECGDYAALAGLAARALQGQDGILQPEQLAVVMKPYNVHYAMPTLLCLENTHNNAAGSVWTGEEIAAVANVAHDHGLKVHIDGARIFNAAIALDVDPSTFTRHVDSIMFCISKGLSAPVGSLLCGSREFIDKAFTIRKRLGGAMRQAGVIAAAGIVALDTMVDRLAEDHDNASTLTAGLNAIDGFTAYRAARPTNIIKVDVADLGWTTEDLLNRWQEHGIRCNPRPPTNARLVTQRHVSAADVAYVIETTQTLVDAI